MNSTNNKGESNIIFQTETYPMNNDLKNFLEETEEAICGNCHRYTKNEARDTRLINFVLDLVDKEVEISMAEHNEARHGNTPDDAYARVSTIINNLRV